MRKYFSAMAAFLCLSGAAAAQTYPDRPITLIITSAPGGVTDVTGRALAQELSKAWGQQVIVENKGGAAHILGAETVAKATPDGYTLLVGESGTFTINPTLLPKDKVPYDSEKDFIPITGLVRIYQALLAGKSLPVTNTTELIALAKQKPGQLTYGTAGIGSALHMNMALFDSMAGVNMVAVHYRGATPALNDLIGGSINTMIVSVASGLPAFRAGQIKMLGVGSPKRMPLVPEVPTVSESGLPGYQAIAWFGLFAPAGTPADIVTKLDKETIRIFNDPAFRARFLDPQMFEIHGWAARGIRRLHQGRTRQVGQGHSRGRHQGGMMHREAGLGFRCAQARLRVDESPRRAPVVRLGRAFGGVSVTIDRLQVGQAPIVEQRWPWRIAPFAPHPKQRHSVIDLGGLPEPSAALGAAPDLQAAQKSHFVARCIPELPRDHAGAVPVRFFVCTTRP